MITAIIDKFVDVCKGGCNADNPLGASTKAPGGSNPTDFDAALTMVFNQFNSTYSTLNLNLNVNEFCNKFLFENPKPFDKQIVDKNDYLAAPVHPSDCLCDKIKTQTDKAIYFYTNTGSPSPSNSVIIDNISAWWMPREYTMPPANTTKQAEFKSLITTLYNSCYSLPSTTTCNFYNPPIQIPPALQCGTAPQNCINCYDYHSVKQNFINTYAIPLSTSIYANVPYTTDVNTPTLSDAQIKANELFASFVNYQTGFSFDWTRYAQFEKVECPYSSSARPENSSDSTSNDSTNSAARMGSTSYSNSILCGDENHLVAPSPADDNPCNDYLALALNQAYEQYNTYLAQLADDFGLKYTDKCLEAKATEQFSVKHATSEYHYTLYYYDQAGNLVKTVPPAGVDNHSSGGLLQFIADVQSARAIGGSKLPTHKLTTEYRYNSLNQVVAQKTPDAGVSQFWYDRLGRLVISQNAQQKADNNFSYTIYDNLGRISEVGQKQLGSIAFNGQATTQDETILISFITGGGTNRSQITRTIYDLPYTFLCSVGSPSTSVLCQENLRNRVSYSMVIDNESGAPPTLTVGGWKSATFYSYDIHGNVNTLLHSYRNGAMAAHNEYKIIKYDYDLISGKVNQVAYQPGDVDAFYHHYEYDAENRLTSAYTSKDAFSKDLDFFWEKEAAYFYYRHGPLARTELGQNRVQGLDYAYTIQGWLKGVNSTVANVSNDMGNDGKASTTNQQFAKDAYGYSLNYFYGDYSPINNTLTNQPFASIIANLPSVDQRNLYNGNISAMAVNIPKLGNPMLYNYKYDQLNRIVAMDAFSGLNNINTGFTPIKLDDYKERISYDANGNILSYFRNATTNGGKPLAMDNLHYYYKTIGTNLTNQLDYVDDDATNTNNYTTDIDKQTSSNYEYDLIGNLTKDVNEGIYDSRTGHQHDRMIEWTVYGKIKKITKNKTINSNIITSYIEYEYDASGNRITKTVTPDITKASETKITCYVRDATGNILSIYEKNKSLNNNDLTQTELNLYGSSRLGTYNVNVNVDTRVYNTTAMIGVADNKGFGITFERGSKYYELTNHLGNVLVTISDKKIQIPSANGLTVLGYLADVTNATDYYPFGMAMPGRNSHAGQGSWINGTTVVNGISYPTDLVVTDRYNATPPEYKAATTIEFVGEYVDNGNDDYIAYIVDGNNPDPNPSSVNGTNGVDAYRYGFNGKENDGDADGNCYDYGFRIYNPALGRFLSVDPLFQSYPWNSTYAFAENEPISNIDLDGEEKKGSNTVDNLAKLKSAEDPVSALDVMKSVGKFLYKQDIKLAEKSAAVSIKIYAISNNLDVLIYNEKQKEKQFQSDASKTISILLYEFATGTGKATRFFSSETPFAKEFAKGKWIEEIKNNFYAKVNDMNLTRTQLNKGGAKGLEIKNIDFSPDNEGFLESIQKHRESNPVQFFVAGTDFIWIDKVDEFGMVTIIVVNQCNKGSLMLHADKLGIIKNEDRNVKSTEDDCNKPLSTTYQIIEVKFKLQTSKIKNNSDVPVPKDNGTAKSDNTSHKIEETPVCTP